MASKGRTHYQNDNLNLSVCSKDSSGSRRQKFRVFKDQETKREISIGKCNEVGKFSEILGNGTKHSSSNSSLRRYHTPRKLPRTPRKSIQTHLLHEKNKTIKLTTKDIINQLKQLIQDFHNIIYQIKKQCNETVKKIMKKMEQNCKTYLQNQLKSFSTFNSSNNISHEPKTSQWRYTRSNTCQQKVISQIKVNNKLNTYSSMEESVFSDFIPNNYAQVEPQKHTKGNNFFSHMIKVRQTIRKDANAIPKKSEIYDKKEAQSLNLNLKNRLGESNIILEKRKSPQHSNSSKEKRDITKSIQKLQSRLKSLKNILNE